MLSALKVFVNKKKMREKIVFTSPLYALVIVLSLSSCVNTRNMAYFNNIPDAVINSPDDAPEPVIQKGDLLSISVTSVSPEASVIFNLPNTPVTGPGGTSQSSALGQAVGYLVDQDGF